MSLVDNYRDYIYDNKALVLSTVDENGNPQVRSIGGYTVEGEDIFFQTGAATKKVSEIANNNNVTLLFQHEGQQVPKNITVYGQANKLSETEAKKASELIKKRRPQINYDPEVNVIYRVSVDTIKVLDFEEEEKVKILKAD